MFAGEQQLPTGPGENPPSQPSLGGLEPDLPSVQADLEKRGQLRLEMALDVLEAKAQIKKADAPSDAAAAT